MHYGVGALLDRKEKTRAAVSGFGANPSEWPCARTLFVFPHGVTSAGFTSINAAASCRKARDDAWVPQLCRRPRLALEALPVSRRADQPGDAAT
jgi:hypothetical protein